MAPLTDEQKILIEANRQRALQLRKAKLEAEAARSAAASNQKACLYNSANLGLMSTNVSARLPVTSNSSIPAVPGNSVRPTMLGNSVRPTVFGNSARPTIPGSSIRPLIPANSVRPTIPGNYVRPIVPGNSVRPLIPANSVRPIVPGNSVRPIVSGNSVRSTIPGNLIRPIIPGNSIRPIIPGNSIRPIIPGNSTRPIIPGNSIRPIIPGNSIRPIIPGNSIRPIIPGNSIRPIIPGNSVRPTVSGNSVRPIVSGNSVRPTIPGSSITPLIPANSVRPTIPGNYVRPRIPGNSVRPTVSGNSVRPTVSGNSVRPTVSGNSVRPTVSGNSVRPTVSGNSVRPTVSGNSVKPDFQATNFKPITCIFSLLNTERFVADVIYHQALIEVFKGISSRKYDPDSKRWNFSLTDHNSLTSKVKEMRPFVVVVPLPTFVLRVVRRASCLPPLESVDLSPLDPRLKQALLPFQLEGVRYGVRLQGRVLIADDMGLGKTIQALAIASYYRQDWPLLIVVPSSVKYSWLASIERWLPGERCTVINTGQDSVRDTDVIISSYDLVAKRAKEFLDVAFGAVIMDECHLLKNYKSARFKAADPLMRRAKRLVLLSGTPALSRPSELYTQVKAVDSTLLPGHQEYGTRYCGAKMTNWGWDMSGSSNLAELQIILQSTCMIRRLKSQVLKQLPAKQRQVVMLDPACIKITNNAELKASTAQLSLSSLKGADRHSALLQCFAITASAKLRAVSEYVKDLLEGDRKFLVFAHHRIMMDKLCETCEQNKVMYIRIEGSTPGDTRQALVDEFQNRAEVRVAVLSLLAANTGLTLTAANLVLFAELYWNPGQLVQAEDRAHRIGQEDSVSVQYLIAQGTSDDHIWPMVQNKLEVLAKAGLSKDNFSDTTASYQKAPEQQNSIKSYLIDKTPALTEEEILAMEGEIDDMPDLDEPPSKKPKIS